MSLSSPNIWNYRFCISKAMKVRELDPLEWYKLDGMEAESVWPLLNPDRDRVIVVENDEKIVGSWILMQVFHMECVWVHPDHRGNGSVARRLLSGMMNLIKSLGLKGAVTNSMTPEIDKIIEKLNGVKIPGEFYFIPVGEK